LNNAGDESLWTTAPWVVSVEDLAFKASFSAFVPSFKASARTTAGGLYGVFKNQGDCVSFVASGGIDVS
jgi:hypothetical protein